MLESRRTFVDTERRYVESMSRENATHSIELCIKNIITLTAEVLLHQCVMQTATYGLTEGWKSGQA